MKIEIISEEIKEEIFITNKTLLLGDNYFLKKKIIKHIDKYFNKKTSKISVLYEGIALDKGQYECITIPSIHAIEHELKLGSNSTLKNIFERIFEYEKINCLEYNTINDLIKNIFYDSSLSKLFDGYIGCDIGDFNSKYLMDMIVFENASENLVFNDIYKFYLNYINILSEITSKTIIVIYDDFGSSLTYCEQKEVYDYICSKDNIINIFSYSSNNYFCLEWLENINVISNHSNCVDSGIELIDSLHRMDSIITSFETEEVINFINKYNIHFNELNTNILQLLSMQDKQMLLLLYKYFNLNLSLK